jgi:hypothetical protein
VKKGVDIPLPDDIAAGIDDVSKRDGWNRPAGDECALPTETWREHVARRSRCLEVREKLTAGVVQDINDLITYNLDIRQFAQDVIENCEGPELVRAFYKSIAEMSVLDPTCGSGAFLFAALNILEPLYEACLERMEVFVSELDTSGEKHHPEKYSYFRKILGQANDTSKHPNRTYFIIKAIVLNNLYGVDIMEEAVEICKLRLFLKLVAQVETVEDLEPLPDIDFNIRAGNTLVGFSSLEAVRQAMTILPDGRYRMVMPEDETALERINESAELADKAFRRFREQQTEHDMKAEAYHSGKQDLNIKLETLRLELDRYLATEYGIEVNKPNLFENWLTSHQPFHWFSEFFGIMHKGGFDVVIGNPPYIAATKVRKQYQVHNYQTRKCPDIYAWVLERNQSLLNNIGKTGMIVPLSLGFSSDFSTIRDILYKSYGENWFLSFGRIPSALFNFDVRVRNTIHLA